MKSGSSQPERLRQRRGPRRRTLGVLGALAAVFLVAIWLLWLGPFWGFPFNAQRHGRVPLTPAWALECWVWEDDANTAAAVRELLDGYAEHDLPVRTILIDSPWSRRYNDFVVDEDRYPEPAAFFQDLESRGYRVVLWMTSLVNRRNKDTALREAEDFYETARSRGYLAGNGHSIRWWKGTGAFLDYSNPEALRWWHDQQQQVFDWGIDGWKLDGADTLFHGPAFLPYQRTRDGWTSTREYMDQYVREEYRHGLSQNPEFIVLVRALDNRYFPLSHPEGFAPFDAAPVTWIGDRLHAWSSKKPAPGSDQDAMRDDDSWVDRGFEGALRDILDSSAMGYGVVGTDVAGYHGPEPIPPRLYIRWAQFAAFTGLFLNGGHGERRLWKRTPEELEIIRRYAWMHTELVPYLYSQVVRCHEGGPSLIQPTMGPYHYLLGDDLLVAPIYRDDTNQVVHLPAGRWRPMFHDSEVLTGPAQVTRSYALDDYPVFIRDGAILPLQVSRAYSGFGSRQSAGLLTWAVYPHLTNALLVHYPDQSGSSRVTVREGATTTVDFEGVPKPHLIRMKLPDRPTAVFLDGAVLTPGQAWSYDEVQRLLWITNASGVVRRYEIHR